jgi:hypothetical protein
MVICIFKHRCMHQGEAKLVDAPATEGCHSENYQRPLRSVFDFYTRIDQ